MRWRAGAERGGSAQGAGRGSQICGGEIPGVAAQSRGSCCQAASRGSKEETRTGPCVGKESCANKAIVSSVWLTCQYPTHRGPKPLGTQRTAEHAPESVCSFTALPSRLVCDLPLPTVQHDRERERQGERQRSSQNESESKSERGSSIAAAQVCARNIIIECRAQNGVLALEPHTLIGHVTAEIAVSFCITASRSWLAVIGLLALISWCKLK